MTRCAIVLVLLFATAASAHPPCGIVEDRQGNVFFTDLGQVWQITPDGSVQIAVPNVHTHELYIDGQDNLHGEHLWYEAGQDTFWCRFWRRNTDGTVTETIPTEKAYPPSHSLLRDRDGAMYFADQREDETVIQKRLVDGTISVHATADFRDLGHMMAAADGTINLMDAGDLRRISPDGTIATIASKLSGQPSPPPNVKNRHYHMGLWTDREGHVYVAVAQEGLILQVDAQGNTRIAARTIKPWAPSGGMYDRQGNLWILEYNGADVRARRIDRNGGERIFSAQD